MAVAGFGEEGMRTPFCLGSWGLPTLVSKAVPYLPHTQFSLEHKTQCRGRRGSSQEAAQGLEAAFWLPDF